MPRHVLGLHTKAERDYAERLADESFVRGMNLAMRHGAIQDVTFEVGMLHAIALLARQEGAQALERHAAGLKAALDREARKY